MDCLYIIKVYLVQGHLGDFSCCEHLEWLKQNDIKRFRWRWVEHEFGRRHDPSVIFRFENEEDKTYFALRWA